MSKPGAFQFPGSEHLRNVKRMEQERKIKIRTAARDYLTRTDNADLIEMLGLQEEFDQDQ